MVVILQPTGLLRAYDISNNLVYWANLFKATTWEEFKNLAKNHPDIEEVGNLIFELNYDNQAKELLEGQRRYREQMNTQYVAGYTDAEEKYELERAKDKAALAEKDSKLAEKDSTIAEKDATIAEKDSKLAEKNTAIAEKDATIAELRAELEKYKTSVNIIKKAP